jgi:hypothetical protein
MRYAHAVVSLLCSVSLWSASPPARTAAQVVSGPGPTWPPEALDFPHTLLTDKAFPENEVTVIPALLAGKNAREWLTTLSLEQRLGAGGEWEVTLPYRIKERQEGKIADGLGEVGVGYKQVLFVHQDTAISTAALEVALPSGGRDRALGYGTVKFAPSLLTGIRLRQVVLQNQIQATIPVEEARAPRTMIYRLAASALLPALQPHLVPTLELELRHNLQGKSQEVVFLAPQFYSGALLHWNFEFVLGVQVPVTGPNPFHDQVGALLLWGLS